MKPRRCTIPRWGLIDESNDISVPIFASSFPSESNFFLPYSLSSY
ncbi:hypothetical protein HanPSC8_Chr02g0060691 [Helianthus annuus]|nr:hypothetical protein HanPSC8_Chr02g0060691 [Helianthus annuus]